MRLRRSIRQKRLWAPVTRPSMPSAKTTNDSDRPAGKDVAESRPNAYRCIECDSEWSFVDIRHTARCPNCGGGLARSVAGPSRGADGLYRSFNRWTIGAHICVHGLAQIRAVRQRYRPRPGNHGISGASRFIGKTFGNDPSRTPRRPIDLVTADTYDHVVALS